MSVVERVDHDLKAAMRAKDTVRIETLRSIRGAIRNRELDTGSTLDENAMLTIIRSLVKQREDSIEQYAEGHRPDLVERETLEKQILLEYLPQAPDEATLQRTIDEVVRELGASTMKDMGRVIEGCKARLGASVDGKTLSTRVRARLTAP
ncbi:MAG: GatB/YqeY domain-containing protein [Myxococcales bacterium]|nr:GatB/YqeY domain-containing protein [Myxococcales bacterium]